MTAEVRNISTPAEQAIAESFAEVLPSLPGGARMRAVREKAFAQFRRSGLPTRRVEEWKYTDLRALTRNAVRPAKRPTLEAATRALKETTDPLAGLERFRLVLVDGYFFPELSDVAALADAGIVPASLADLLKADDEISERLFTRVRASEGNVAVALNVAFAPDGVAIRVAPGANIARPIEIAHIATNGASYARHALDVGAGANVKLIETHRGATGAGTQTNVVMGGIVGKGAGLTYAKVQVEAAGAIHFGATMMGLSPAAELRHLVLQAGAQVSRSELYLTTGGEHARATLSGATMANGRQHADNTLTIGHALGDAMTRVLYKSVVDDEAEGVFQGKIIVDPDAQKTDAKMMSKALLLSPEAQFAAKPELEIFADDVQCGHGATSGRIDDEQLFYLMARGVPKAVAERLLIEAFLDDAIDALGDEAIGDALKRTVSAWLDARKAAP
jgi:Fe-S cluster assembly protein SufD